MGEQSMLIHGLAAVFQESSGSREKAKRQPQGIPGHERKPAINPIKMDAANYVDKMYRQEYKKK
jgi:hypothetical protein